VNGNRIRDGEKKRKRGWRERERVREKAAKKIKSEKG